jgi:hypothetical protein
MEDGYIEIGEDGGGFWDFLDGKAIHAGTMLQVLIGGYWIDVRYEADFHTRQAWLYTDDAVLPLSRNTMRCRWPARE